MLCHLVGNDYAFFAGYVVLQFIVLAQAWNILGGYTGYVNFGSAAFFALGAYTAVFFHKFHPLPIPLLMGLGGLVSGLAGLGMGYLALRLRGAFFAIATLALAVVLQTLVVNWSYVGGARGAYVIRPESVWLIGNYVHYLFLLMLALAVLAIVTARTIERSRLGYGFATIRDDELAAEASGVPTLRLKLIATTLSGAFMGMAGAPFPYYIGYVQPAAAFALDYAVNAIAMPMIGGTTTWIGPLVGAILVASLQQWASVTISSELGLLVVGLLLVGFVVVAPSGIVGLVRKHVPANGGRAMSEPLLEVAGLGKRFGGFVALDGIDLAVARGERVGLIGPNGSGKSTLVNCICGTLAHDSGTVRFDGQRIDRLLTHERTRRGIARSFQLPRPFASLTVAENLRVPMLYTVDARPGNSFPPPSLRRAAPISWRWSGSPTRPADSRATSPRWRCASSSSPAPWRRSRRC